LSGSEWFLFVFFLIPIYGLLIWSYLNPEESHLWGRRWMYVEEPELSEDSIWIHKIIIMVIIIVMTIILLLNIYQSF
jgi:3-deoxy-D-manno-octulosonic-acid transferase